MSRHSDVPSADQYRAALQQLEEKGKLLPRHKALLVAHYGSGAVTDVQLSSLVKRGAHYASLHYGKLAKMVCKALDFDPPDRYKTGKPVLVSGIAQIIYPDGPGDRYRWRMRPQVAQALAELGWVEFEKEIATYILTWNPGRTPWYPKEYGKLVLATKKDQIVSMRWSCGKTKRITRGDSLFLLRQGSDRGIIASGYADSDPYYDTHWDKSRNDKALYIDMKCDVLLNVKDRLPVEVVRNANLDVAWDSLRASGRPVSTSSAAKLRGLWQHHLAGVGRRSSVVRGFLPEEVVAPARFTEGATQTVSINAYERNSAARQACIDHYGYTCVVCGHSMADLYGGVAEDIVHVHHLKDLATIGEKYEVDPIADLRPVCPNCHAVLHTETPALDVDTLRKIVVKHRKK